MSDSTGNSPSVLQFTCITVVLPFLFVVRLASETRQTKGIIITCTKQHRKKIIRKTFQKAENCRDDCLKNYNFSVSVLSAILGCVPSRFRC